MKQSINFCGHSSLLLAVLLSVVTLAACDNSMNIGPTAPASPFVPNNSGELKTLSIDGSLVSSRGSCLKATILFDGEEIPGARVRCDSEEGCADLHVFGSVSALAGHHTVTFQVLRQLADTEEYQVSGSVQISRPDISGLPPMALQLPSKRAALRRGEGVDFAFDLWD